jgi:hypothetical protein
MFLSLKPNCQRALRRFSVVLGATREGDVIQEKGWRQVSGRNSFSFFHFPLTSFVLNKNLFILNKCLADDGDDRDRTDNPRLAKPVLSQLSYVPFIGRTWIRTTDLSFIRAAL